MIRTWLRGFFLACSLQGESTLAKRFLFSVFLARFHLGESVEPSGVQALKNPNPLKDVEGLAVLAVAELS